MLDDRYYMRRPQFQVGQSVTVLLLIINVAAFVAQIIISGNLQRPDNGFLQKYFELSVGGLKQGYVWQLLTFQFMHGNIFHILMNCLVIYFFGRAVEESLGRRHFLTLYLASGIVGGLFQMAAGLLLGGPFAAPVVGASAGGFGIVSAFALLFPDTTFLLFLFIPMRARFFLIITALLAVWGIAFPDSGFMGPGVAHAAHLGGMVTGIIFIRYAIHWHWPRLRRPASRQPRTMVKVASGSSALWGRNKESSQEELPAEEFLSKEVDPILDKISAHGIQSLTERERRILESARTRMGKR